MKEKLILYFYNFVNKNIVFHLFVYFLLVFLTPFFSKVIWLFINRNGWHGIFIAPTLVFLFLFPSLKVFILDVFKLLIWFLLNRFNKFSIRNVVMVYIYI